MPMEFFELLQILYPLIPQGLVSCLKLKPQCIQLLNPINTQSLLAF